MDRYQFEDAISAYLDNELPLSERKAFEEFMNTNPDAKNLVDSIRTNMTSFKILSPIKALCRTFIKRSNLKKIDHRKKS